MFCGESILRGGGCIATLRFNPSAAVKFHVSTIRANMIKKILFVCLGNICRSPAAEGIMKKKAIARQFEIDSAGTAGYHVGDLPDVRMRTHAAKRGYTLDSRARKFDPDVDFEKFDMIAAMDHENLADLQAMDKKKRYRDKLFLMSDFCERMSVDEVPDPYYEGPEGFEHVIDILEDACDGLLKRLAVQTSHDRSSVA